MKLTGELKEKVANAESAEQAKDIIAEVGVELTDDEVASVAGGWGTPQRSHIDSVGNPGDVSSNPSRPLRAR